MGSCILPFSFPEKGKKKTRSSRTAVSTSTNDLQQVTLSINYALSVSKLPQFFKTLYRGENSLSLSLLGLGLSTSKFLNLVLCFERGDAI